MRILFLLIALLPISANAANLQHRKDVSTYDRQLEYKCISEKRDNSWEELRACVKEKKGTSVITVEKFWKKEPNKATDKSK